jgi:hypothetical protein
MAGKIIDRNKADENKADENNAHEKNVDGKSTCSRPGSAASLPKLKSIKQ